ncbi:MAG: hypothetical protein KIT58_06990 [Planctomycetota bacterium]|nr:hypothetical protein [Planctomycetota bacterium]
MTPVLLVALDSVGVDPLGHDRAESVYAGSAFLFPRGRSGPLLDLPDAPVEGALVETDVTGGRTEGSIECAITYTTLFTGRDALAEHGLVQGLGLREGVLEGLLSGDTLFHRFAPSAALANALFPAHLPFLRSSYVEDLLPAFGREEVEARVTLHGAPVRLTGPDKHGLAELFTLAELNQNPFVLAARRAGLRLRTWDDVRAEQALTSTLTHALERSMDLSLFDPAPLPPRTPAEAARVLAGLAAEHRFTFYKYQTADLVAHTHRVDLARETFAEVEAFLGALLCALPADARVVVTSDHGHLEQVGFTRGHPRSRVPTWVFGPGARAAADGLRTPAAIFRHLAALA